MKLYSLMKEWNKVFANVIEIQCDTILIECMRA
jgi:hypothetical protein